MMQNISSQKRGTITKRPFPFNYLKNFFNLVSPILSDPYWIHVIYFTSISLVGLIPLRLLPTKTKTHLNVIDALFTSVSSATVSSLGVVPMEDLSHIHLVVMIILMLLGAEVFTSSCSLFLARLRLKTQISMNNSAQMNDQDSNITTDHGGSTRHFGHHLHARDQMRRESIVYPKNSITDPEDITHGDLELWEINEPSKMVADFCSNGIRSDAENVVGGDLDYQALTFLGYLGFGYFLFVQLAGFMLVCIYFSLSKGGERILKERGISRSLFAVFTVVSSFANCGFVPLNDNMMPFRKHGALLMIIAVQILMGNTMFGPCFTAILQTLRRFSRVEGRRQVCDYVVKHGRRLFADHFFSTRQNIWLLLFAGGFITIEMVMLFALHWDDAALDGLTAGEKLIGGVFQSVAIRHAGENIVNPQLLSPAILVIYIVFMYLPPYPLSKVGEDITSIKPSSKEESSKNDENWSISMQFEKLVLHDSCYLLVAVVLICMIERNKLSQDPLNFNVLAIVFEVVSGYGNVGISLGYNCILFNKVSGHHCKDVSYSLSGKCSTKGKIVIMMVMVFGRLKTIKSSMRKKLFL